MQVAYTRCDTSLGPVYVSWTDAGLAFLTTAATEADFVAKLRKHRTCDPVRSGLRQAELTAMLEGWLRGEPYEGPIDYGPLSPFLQGVLEELRRVERGAVVTYGELARRVGRPGAARAVGTAMRRNPVPLLVPCHRVVQGSGKLGNYSMGGPAVKERLLRLEGVQV